MSKVDEAMWAAINKWESTAPIEILLNANALRAHMLNEHGIKISGPFGRDHEIVDQQKYTMFLLRFG